MERFKLGYNTLGMGFIKDTENDVEFIVDSMSRHRDELRKIVELMNSLDTQNKLLLSSGKRLLRKEESNKFLIEKLSKDKRVLQEEIKDLYDVLARCEERGMLK